MLKSRLFLLGLSAFVCLMASTGFAVVDRTTKDGTGGGLPSDPAGGFRAEMPGVWFVELASAPLAEASPVNEAKYLAKLKQEKQDFRSEARSRGLRFTERYAYDRLWNGLSVEMDPADLSMLANTPGVVAVYPVEPVDPPEVALPVDLESGSAADLFTAITMTGAAEVQAEGITGAGVKVGVIDSGIDYTHPDLGAGFGPGFRVEGGFDFVGNAYIGPGTFPDPDPDPRDCNGHGTHVSGIIGAKGHVTGVAPGVTFRAYKIFGCGGGSQSDVILAAMELAWVDGVQVVNMSLGNPFQWPQYPTGRAADNLVNRGIVVVASAGNSAANGLYAVGTPAIGRKVIAVASVENAKVHSRATQILGGPTIGYQPLRNALMPPLSGSALVKNIGHGCSTTDRSLFIGLQGKIAVMGLGLCGLREKMLNARSNGAVAALIYNDTPGIFIASLGFPEIPLPAGTLSLEDGSYLAARARFPTTLFWTNDFVEVPNMSAGNVSSFSSYGAGPDLDLKPDLAAPGGMIFSTLPLSQGGYGLLSGTSMSSPHVAGIAALLLEARPNTPSQVVRDLLQNSSVPRPWFLDAHSGLLEPIHRQGAGLVDIHATLSAPARVFPGKIAMGEMEGRAVTRRLSVENPTSSDLAFDLSHRDALATEPGVFDVQAVPAAAGVSFSPSSLRVPAGGTAPLDVTFTEPAELAEGGLFGGFLVLAPQGGGRELRVPYLGLKGDYQHLVTLNPEFTPFGNPLLSPGLDFRPSQPLSIDPTRGEAAFILFHLDYSVRRLRLELFDAHTGRSYGRLLEIDYFPRNSGPDFFYFIPWQGNDSNIEAVPAGDYTLRFSAGKALGQDDNPAHWEVWSSPTVTVLR